MTLVDNNPPLSSNVHVGELRLRRFRLGELAGADHEEIARHTSDCGPCRARLRSLDEEQRQFEREISFERFAGGVERARRVPRVMPRRLWTFGAVAFAAAAALTLVLRPAHENRTKGVSIDATARIAPGDGSAQRVAAPGSFEGLRRGERVRFGFHTDRPAHLVAVSIDDAGAVSALYPPAGGSLDVSPGHEWSYLPDSLEFTGQGKERVFLLLAERPLAVEDVQKAARAAHAQAEGNLDRLGALPVEGRGAVKQFTWLFKKP